MEQTDVGYTSFLVTNPLRPTGPAAQLFIAGAGLFEITAYEPPVQRVTIVGVNLPDPGIFGPYSNYLAIILAPGNPSPIAEINLSPTLAGSVWAGSQLLTFGGTLPRLFAEVRPVLYGVRQGPVILIGTVFQ